MGFGFQPSLVSATAAAANPNTIVLRELTRASSVRTYAGYDTFAPQMIGLISQKPMDDRVLDCVVPDMISAE
jgi:hypothetical protein